MATLVARCCRKANPLQCVQGYGKQRTHKIFISPRNRKKCCHGRCCRKTNQLKSMQGFGMQSFPRKIFKPKKHKKVLPWQHLLSGVAEKRISSNLCSGMESKEPIKIFTKIKIISMSSRMDIIIKISCNLKLTFLTFRFLW